MLVKLSVIKSKKVVKSMFETETIHRVRTEESQYYWKRLFKN